MTTTAPKRVLLGITGGVAAYKAAALVRLLVRAGIDVRVVMTEAGTRFITPTTLQALSGQKVWTDLWDSEAPDHMAHIELSRDRDLVVVAPATADFIAKAALGLADDLLSSIVLARECPLLVAPAMNRQMWEQPATQRNVGTLRGDGVVVVGPAIGDQACGETGPGRMVEPEALLEEIAAVFQPKVLAGKRVLVSAGPTEEPIDPVRVLATFSIVSWSRVTTGSTSSACFWAMRSPESAACCWISSSRSWSCLRYLSRSASAAPLAAAFWASAYFCSA